ncbi:hypothetical protein GCM10007385_29450 [Tateyamaria omphalii]|uniref:hypothetical protein n=1 Tax=Tateyamaria omphalii TaxID=299262 RepID=UPI00167403C5|nr:hypothetical protein [Tateyamaria omphalii]GGX58758.1 hypothetical protein GCM10007385_29450 [Tateyamaria omphalii]
MAKGEFENDRFVKGIGVVLNFLVPAMIAGVGAILLYFSSELRSLQRSQAETNVKLAGMPAVDMEQVRSALAAELAQLDLVTIQQISDIVNYSSQNAEKYLEARLAKIETELLLVKGVALKIDKNMERSIRNEAQLSQLDPAPNRRSPTLDARDILFSFSDQVSRVNYQFEVLENSLQNTRRTALATNGTIRTLDNELRDLGGRISTVEQQLESRLTDVKSELNALKKILSGGERVGSIDEALVNLVCEQVARGTANDFSAITFFDVPNITELVSFIREQGNEDLLQVSYACDTAFIIRRNPNLLNETVSNAVDDLATALNAIVLDQSQSILFGPTLAKNK